MPKDFRGQELEVGDRVVYVSAEGVRMVAEVIAVKNKIELRGPLGDEFWAKAENCFAVDLFKNESREKFAAGGVINASGVRYDPEECVYRIDQLSSKYR